MQISVLNKYFLNEHLKSPQPFICSVWVSQKFILWHLLNIQNTWDFPRSPPDRCHSCCLIAQRLLHEFLSQVSSNEDEKSADWKIKILEVSAIFFSLILMNVSMLILAKFSLAINLVPQQWPREKKVTKGMMAPPGKVKRI